ncbi:probable G-protein coupled receptor 160 isoform X2 [Vulpes lagopus]|uniref:probable G-protein coupled receptor 160 isoform X2 n=1 Tax=Vulpes lagopus TaxID=494514 RepID=UPI001BCA06C3|nr:probable G-protein coupled receptor 160 isoform X2 [Vulpes lagopus]
MPAAKPWGRFAGGFTLPPGEATKLLPTPAPVVQRPRAGITGRSSFPRIRLCGPSLPVGEESDLPTYSITATGVIGEGQELFTWHFGMPGIKSKIIEGSKTEIISQERPAGESRGWKTK